MANESQKKMCVACRSCHQHSWDSKAHAVAGATDENPVRVLVLMEVEDLSSGNWWANVSTSSPMGWEGMQTGTRGISSILPLLHVAEYFPSLVSLGVRVQQIATPGPQKVLMELAKLRKKLVMKPATRDRYNYCGYGCD